jgi:hypothetical protein
MRVTGKIFFSAGVLIGISAFIGGFIAYFVVGIRDNGEMYDGWGRSLIESPWFVRLIFGQEKLWVGWKWFIVDIVVFWSLIGVAYAVCAIGLMLLDKKSKHTIKG